jgi:hypothetical protein
VGRFLWKKQAGIFCFSLLVITERMHLKVREIMVSS